MSVKPILFKGPMVSALLVGIKNQTRRIARRQDLVDGGYGIAWLPGVFSPWTPPYDSGDLLWVRETWKPHSSFAGMRPRDVPNSHIFYAADHGYSPSNTPWCPSIYMPRWASRLTLEVTAVKVERLQDISGSDAIAEGCVAPGWIRGKLEEQIAEIGRDAYANLWEKINGRNSWAANPWVVALTFIVHNLNVDELLRQREAA